MKILILLFLLTSFLPGLIFQKNSYKSCVKISRSEFEHHQPVFSFIKNSKRSIKHNGIIRIKTANKNIVLKDDREFQEYRYLGELTTAPFILIHELEPNTEEYYLINKETAHIDTLVRKPIFFKNGSDIVCLEGSGTDMKQRIQFGQIANGRFRTKHLFTLKKDISPDYVYWFDTNSIFIKEGKNYWRLNF